MPKYWIDKEGNRILISDLQDKHLDNILKILRKQAYYKEFIEYQIDNVFSVDAKPDSKASIDNEKILKRWYREKKLKRTLGQEDDNWKKYVDPIYWDIEAEKIKRENTLPGF